MNTASLIRKHVFFPVGKKSLQGILTIPEKPKGLILFVHGKGSSRLSPRNKLVAEELNEFGFASFLFDLQTEEEKNATSTKYSLPFLTERIIAATSWVKEYDDTHDLEIGYFGSNVAVSAALNASKKLGLSIKAIVSRGGAPDLSQSESDKVNAPVLLIVGGSDKGIAKANKDPKSKPKSVKGQPANASDPSYEDLRQLEIVANISVGWFDMYLSTKHENTNTVY